MAPRHTYPGNPDPLAFGEDTERGAVLVTVDAKGDISRERHRVAVSQLAEIDIDISGCGHQQEVRDRIAANVQGRQGLLRVTLTGKVSPDLDLRMAGVGDAFPHLDGLQVRIGRIWAGYDLEHLKEEPTVRGQFIRNVLAREELSEEQRQRVLLMGLRALEGRGDLEVA